MNESLAHLHRALVDALASRGHHAPNQPVTVAEIYQDLIPYRLVRTTLGFAMNADYEHALLQLLAGDGGYARVEPAQVQEELRLELKSSNPNVGVFRNYAACDVFLSLPADFELRRQSGSKPAPVGQNADRTANQISAAPARNGVHTVETQQPPAAARTAAATNAQVPAAPQGQRTVAVPRVAEPVGVACSGCKRVLPAGRSARFCPFCGADQTSGLCKQCREPLEPGWKFCVACGAPAA